MMTPIFLFFLLSSIFTVNAQQGKSIVKPGSILTPTTNSSWLSPSGLYAFGFYKQGNGYAVGVFLAGIPQKTVVWTANRDNPPVSTQVTLNFTSDGRLVLQSAQGTETSVANFDPASSASMLDTGNFVVYNSDNQSIWESFQNPTDTLLPTQRLLPNDSVVLKSSVSESNQSTGRFRAVMQQDGYVALYPVGTNLTLEYGYWSTSNGVPNGNLNLDDQGLLYVTNSIFNLTVSQSRNSAKGTVLYRLRMEDDGFLRLYSYNLQEQNGSWSIIWSPLNETGVNICFPRGLCGVNAFCDPGGNDINCTCLPGFVFIDESKRTSGCERNSTTENCNEKGMNTTMEEVSGIIWENLTYNRSVLLTKQDCNDACLQDCSCEAALFNDEVCGKQKLPLRFVNIKISNDPKETLAFIKVRTSTPSSDGNVTKKKGLEILIIGVSLVIFAFIMLAISGIVIYRSRIFANENILNTGNIVLSDEDVGPRSFTYIELEKITNGFKEELGRGSFGIVYKGTIENGQKIVAVKKLERLLVDREREFQTEMKVIGRTHHKNLIRLLGYCHDGPNRLLVCAKISDFGLAKLLKPDQSKISTGIRGTRGYVAPEWHQLKCPVTVKVDVYSFGIVLLEIISCRRCVDSNLPEEEAILEEWSYRCFECGELGKLVNDEKVEMRQLERMVKVALWCILYDPSLRPSMKKVLLMLEGTADIPVPSNRSFVSQYDQGFEENE
uniref:Receptor-like serine/threonine-protein kinase n=1 Tax=Quercus lobata TaxID=97700 RepID=A0A7N2MS31_QUELO